MEFDAQAEIVKDAAHEVFLTMLGTELHVEEPFADDDPLIDSEVTGIIGLGGYMTGSVSIHVGQEQARDFTARLVGADVDDITSNDDIRDAVGELANMLAGAVKTALTTDGEVEIALPVVSMGKAELAVRGGKGVVVPFEDYTGRFHVELVLSGPTEG